MGVLIRQKILIEFMKISQVTVMVAGGPDPRPLPWPATPMPVCCAPVHVSKCLTSILYNRQLLHPLWGASIVGDLDHHLTLGHFCCFGPRNKLASPRSFSRFATCTPLA